MWMHQTCWGWWLPVCIWSVTVAKHWRLLEYWFQEGREERKWLLTTIGHRLDLKFPATFLKLLYFNLRIIAILWWLLPYINMNQPQVYMCSPPSWTPLTSLCTLHFQDPWKTVWEIFLKHLSILGLMVLPEASILPKQPIFKISNLCFDAHFPSNHFFLEVL